MQHDHSPSTADAWTDAWAETPPAPDDGFAFEQACEPATTELPTTELPSSEFPASELPANEPVAAFIWDDAPAPLLPSDIPAEPVGDAPPPEGLHLPARPTAAETCAALVQLIDSSAPAALDASAVERLPVPVIQVLLSAIVQLREQGRPLIVRNPSFSFSLAFEALGFGPDREVFTVEYC